MRLFIAINFPEEIKREIEKTIEKLVSDFSQVIWTKKENIHLTLKFLGYIGTKNPSTTFRASIENKRDNKNSKDEERLLEKIRRGIESSSMGIKPFELVFEKLGYFEREQIIIWLGAKTDSQLSLLIERLDKEMEKLGFIKERREFTPHITVGRGKRLDKRILEEIKQTINTKQYILPKSFTVSAINLMNSTLTPKGPIYREIRSFNLRVSG